MKTLRDIIQKVDSDVKMLGTLAKITFDQCKNIKMGEEIVISDGYVLYYYSNGDSLVLVDDSDGDWIEVYAIQYDQETKELFFDKL